MEAMTFSIRNLLTMVVVAALGIVVWRSRQDAQRDQYQLAMLRTEIKRAEDRLHVDNPVLHQARRDEYEAIRKLRKQCDANIELLREKYGSIEPRGPRILSIKNLPSMRGDTGGTPVALRVYVPEEREVWLKYGVHDHGESSSFGRTLLSPDFESALMRQSPIGPVGPYEKLLTPGHHVLSMTIGDAEAGSLPLRITFDSIALIDSRLKSASQIGGGVVSSKPKMQQMDFRDGKLHWGSLISKSMSFPCGEEDNPRRRLLFHLWLSNESSGFSDFPGSQ
jgi:hypothetical protein